MGAGGIALDGVGAQFENGAVVGAEADGEGLIAESSVASGNGRGVAGLGWESEAASGAVGDMEAVEEGGKVALVLEAVEFGVEKGAQRARKGTGAAAVGAAELKQGEGVGRRGGESRGGH